MKRQKTIHHKEYCEIINVLKAERRRLGLSQSDVAEALGITQSEVSKIETNERRVDVWEFKNLLALYRTPHNETLKRAITTYLGLDQA
jgi:transcriptional regulator with XRE-family HTH domain